MIENARKLPGPVLAEGEVTGHMHALPETEEVFEREDKVRVFSLATGAPLTHQEHGTIPLPAGEYAADQVREYDHYAEEARRVAD